MTRSTHSTFERFFPTPRFLQMQAVGLDIGDRFVRAVSLKARGLGYEVDICVERPIPAEFLSTDLATNRKFSAFLSSFKNENGLKYINAALPEEKAYLFKTRLPLLKKSEIRLGIEARIEEFIPLKAEEVIFDYRVVHVSPKGDHLDAAVSAVPSRVADNYAELFHDAGLTPLSFEVAEQAVARAVVSCDDGRTLVIANIGSVKTGLFIVSGGVVQFSSTVALGGEQIISSISKVQGVPMDEAEKIKNEGFLNRTEENAAQKVAGAFEQNEVFFSFMSVLSALRDEIGRLMSYWKSHKKEEGAEEDNPIEGLVLCGTDASIEGLVEYFSLSLSIPVEVADVWKNVYDLEEKLPPIDFSSSLRYAAAVGLALPKNICKNV